MHQIFKMAYQVECCWFLVSLTHFSHTLQTFSELMEKLDGFIIGHLNCIKKNVMYSEFCIKFKGNPIYRINVIYRNDEPLIMSYSYYHHDEAYHDPGLLLNTFQLIMNSNYLLNSIDENGNPNQRTEEN